MKKTLPHNAARSFLALDVDTIASSDADKIYTLETCAYSLF